MNDEWWVIKVLFKLFGAIFYVLCKMRLIVPAIILILMLTLWEDWYYAHEMLGNIILGASIVLSLLSWFVGPVRKIIANKREKDYIKATKEKNQLMERMLLEEHLKKIQNLNTDQVDKSEAEEFETL